MKKDDSAFNLNLVFRSLRHYRKGSVAAEEEGTGGGSGRPPPNDVRMALFGAMVGHPAAEEHLPREASDFVMCFLSRIMDESNGPPESEPACGNSAVPVDVVHRVCDKLMVGRRCKG